MRTGRVQARGLTFHTLEAGEGPLVLCLHGFPDHARSFRHQLPVLAEAGFRAVAPYMRGYAPTDAAPDGDYRTAALGLDVVALIEALGYEDAVVFGHDWGGTAAYGAAVAAPKRVRRLVTAAVPYGLRFLTNFTSNYDQLRRSFYVYFFQTPFAETAVMHNDFAFIERLWRDWSPGYIYPPEEMAALKETLRKPGVVQAAIGYYRAMFSQQPMDAAVAELQARLMATPIEVPTLYLHGADDGCIGVSVIDGMADSFAQPLRVEVVPHAGHFLHLERPDVVNRLLLDFIRS